MSFKILTGLLGLILVVGFLLPPIIKLKSVALAIVVLIGIGLAGYEFYESVRHSHDHPRPPK